MELKARAARIKMVVFDVDGVLTDGKIIIGNTGELYKSFDAQDGLGISLLRLAGLKTAIITGRSSEIVKLRAAELKIDALFQGARNKLAALRRLREAYAIADEEIAYVGDDLIDLAVMRRVGLACAVANAVDEVKAAAQYVASRKGGDGGVRQVAEAILKARGQWDEILSAYLEEKSVEAAAQ